MQKFLFFLFFACLSANVNAQKIDTLALISEVLKTYTDTNFLDTLKTETTELSEQVVFFTQQNVQQNAIKNAYVWDKNKQSLAFMDMDLQKMSNQGAKWIVIPVYLSIENNIIHLFFNTSSKIETIPPIYSKIDTLPSGETREIDLPFCPNTIVLPNGEARIISPKMLRIIDIPTEIFGITPNKTPIYFIPDAQFLYNSTTEKYEMQPFQRQNERRDWFAQTYLKAKPIQKKQKRIRTYRTSCCRR